MESNTNTLAERLAAARLLPWREQFEVLCAEHDALLIRCGVQPPEPAKRTHWEDLPPEFDEEPWLDTEYDR